MEMSEVVVTDRCLFVVTWAGPSGSDLSSPSAAGRTLSAAMPSGGPHLDAGGRSISSAVDGAEWSMRSSQPAPSLRLLDTGDTKRSRAVSSEASGILVAPPTSAFRRLSGSSVLEGGVSSPAAPKPASQMRSPAEVQPQV